MVTNVQYSQYIYTSYKFVHMYCYNTYIHLMVTNVRLHLVNKYIHLYVTLSTKANHCSQYIYTSIQMLYSQ